MGTLNNISDQTNGKLNEIIEFADENKLTDELWLSLSRFFRYIAQGNSVVLAPDFAPMSLTFGIYDADDRQILNGGFIYHGPSNGSSPIFSVEIDPSNKPHWSIHT